MRQRRRVRSTARNKRAKEIEKGSEGVSRREQKEAPLLGCAFTTTN